MRDGRQTLQEGYHSYCSHKVDIADDRRTARAGLSPSAVASRVPLLVEVSTTDQLHAGCDRPNKNMFTGRGRRPSTLRFHRHSSCALPSFHATHPIILVVPVRVPFSLTAAYAHKKGVNGPTRASFVATSY